ncbi:hypothetical protein GW17_00028998 [Ensete ventricosum]|nr:hypothetical protein GW17_00028998 [Ensete ventricosum]
MYRSTNRSVRGPHVTSRYHRLGLFPPRYLLKSASKRQFRPLPLAVGRYQPREKEEEREKVGEEKGEYRDQTLLIEAPPGRFFSPRGEKERDDITCFALVVLRINGSIQANSKPTLFRYIEFYDVMSVPMAIALSGQPLLGQPVMVKPSEAEKNLVQSTAATGGTGLTGANSGAARKLYVGNLHLNITEPQLRQVFEPFGQVELVQLPLDPQTGLCKGYGFIQVSAVTDQAGVQDVGTNAGDLDDDEGGGLLFVLTFYTCWLETFLVPGALAASAVNSSLLPAPTASVLGPPLVPSILQPSVPALAGLPASGLPVASASAPALQTAGVPTECLLLKNMFDPNVEVGSRNLFKIPLVLLCQML